MNQMIPLRPHHALCIAFFEGKGYNPEFIENMTALIHLLKDNTKVKLTVSSDLICLSCPNIKDNLCNQNTKINRYDKAVLFVCQLEEGEILEWQELSNRVNSLIIKAKKLKDICGDCSWFQICKEK